MRSGTKACAAAVLSVVVLATVCVWGYTIDPDPATRWILIALGLPLIWGYVELAQVRGQDREIGVAIMVFHRWTLAWVGLVVALQLGIRLAVAAELLSPDQWPVARRVIGIVFGMGLMIFGNHLPKLLSPWRLEDEPFDWQHVHRFCGWAFLLGGLGVTACWLIFPAGASELTNLIVVVTMVLAVGRKLASLVSGSAARAGAR